MRGSIEVHRYLTERGIPHEFYRLDRPLRHIDEVAPLLELHSSQVASAELFETTGVPLLALVPAGVGVSAEGVARASGETFVRAAVSSRIAEQTGFLPHWLPPVAHERPSRAFVDVDLADVGVLYAAGGDPGVMVVLRSGDLIRATSATVVALASSRTRTARPDPVRALGSSLIAG